MTKLQDTIASIQELFAQGFSSTEIASVLNISVQMVEEQIKPHKSGESDFQAYDRYDY